MEEHYNASESLSASGKRLMKFGGGSWESASGGAEHLGLTYFGGLAVESQQGRLVESTLRRCLVKDESS